MGGSLRIPAYCCGVATLKPTTGRIPFAASLEPRDHGMSGQAMLAVGPLARSVADLRLALSIMAGRDLRDPRSVDVPLDGPAPSAWRVARVTQFSGAPLPASTLAALDRAAARLRSAGWEVDDVVPPELTRVDEVFTKLLATDLSIIAPQLQPFLSEKLFDHLVRLGKASRWQETSNHRLHSERSRLMRVWSAFFGEYPVVIGPNFARPIWPIDADLDPVRGIELLRETVRFVTPGNALGIPCVALPMGIVDGLPEGIAIYADSWREDLCLRAAEIVEAGNAALPVDPVRA
jgi:amidase